MRDMDSSAVLMTPRAAGGSPVSPSRRAPTLIQRAVRAAASVALVACLDDTPVDPHGVATLAISAQVVAAQGHSVEIAVSYARTDGQRELFRRSFPIDTGVTAIPVSVDVSRCLADPERESADADACALIVGLTLRDSTGTLIDSATVANVQSRPGQTSHVPPVSLGIRGARLEIVSGNHQVVPVGSELLLPVEVRVVDSTGAPLANRAVVVTTLTGGGSGPSEALLSDAAGLVRLPYQAGPIVGENTFQVTSGSVASVIVAASAIRTRSTLAAGSRFTCALDAAGMTRCWGANHLGALGIGAATDTSLPRPVPGAPPFVAIAASRPNNATSQAACGLTVQGVAYCWGVNQAGQLGVPVTDQCSALGFPPSGCSRTPAPLEGDHRFASISVGGGSGNYGARICAVKVGGEAFCWGEGTYGARGDGTTATSTTPVAVAGGHRFVRISTGQVSTCGVTAIGDLYCWGRNDSGQLGNGTRVESAVPVRVSSTMRFTKVEVGSSFACGLVSSGAVYCWGAGPYGTTAGERLVPELVPGGGVFVDLSAGLQHACALESSGAAACWGNSAASLGIGLSGGPGREAATLVQSTVPFAELSAGFHTCAARVPDELFCWGPNPLGELGIGNRVDSPLPARVNLLGVSPGAPATVAPNVAPNGSATAGSVASSSLVGGLRPAVRVTDANGVAVPGVQVNWTVAGGGGSIAGSVSTTNSAGIAVSGTWRLGVQPGINLLHATVSSLGGSTAVFTATGVNPGAPAQTNRSADRSVPVGGVVDLLPSLIVYDADGHVVPAVPVTFSRTGTGGALAPALPVTRQTNADGLATLDSWVADTVAGVDTVTLYAPGVPGSPFAFLLTRLPLAASQLAFTQPPMDVGASSPFAQPVGVAVRDRYGNPVTTPTAVTITLEGDGAATLSGTTTVMSQNGVATFTSLAISALGAAYRLRATSGSVSTLSPSFAVAFSWKSISVSPGGNSPFHACGIGTDDRAYCWGPNSHGQVGNGATAPSVLVPTRVLTSSPALAISAGGRYTCGRFADGVLCWGLGNPTPAAAAAGLSVRSVEVGYQSVCAVETDGDAHCWSTGSPAPVPGSISWQSMRPGFNNTCGLTTAGNVHCWTFGGFGGNGNGSDADIQPPGIPVSGGRLYTMVHTGANFSCALAAGGSAWCWGRNSSGQLGVPLTTTQSNVPVEVAGGHTFVAVGAGTNHACGLTAAGSIYCWGSNQWGELGNASTVSSFDPVLVAGGRSYSSIAIGGLQSCAIATNGIAYCWGQNFNGLGTGDLENAPVPRRLANPD